MNVEFDVNVKLKGKMSLRRLVILLISGALIVGNLVSTDGNAIKKLEEITHAITNTK